MNCYFYFNNFSWDEIGQDINKKFHKQRLSEIQEKEENFYEQSNFEMKNTIIHQDILFILKYLFNNDHKVSVDFKLFYFDFFTKFFNLNHKNLSNLFFGINNNLKKQKEYHLINSTTCFLHTQNFYLFLYYYLLFFNKLNEIRTMLNFNISIIKNSIFEEIEMSKYDYNKFLENVIKHFYQKIENKEFEKYTFDIFGKFIHNKRI
jgi:hypothetical protein